MPLGEVQGVEASSSTKSSRDADRLPQAVTARLMSIKGWLGWRDELSPHVDCGSPRPGMRRMCSTVWPLAPPGERRWL